jgi:tRNA1(Val) A37 N6-methylase TrmN6
MNSISKFHNEPFIDALKTFFEELKLPVDYLADEPASANDILGERYKANNEAHKLIDDVYALGMVNDAIFEGTETFKNLAEVKKLNADYDGLLLFGVTLKSRKDGLPITRSHFAEITRVFNRTFPYTPVTIIFKYDNLISFANSERIPYKQEWREGEKVGKVTMLKDVNPENTHSAHKKILYGLTIDRQKIDSFKLLYNYWQSVFSLQALNNQFYSDLQDWFYYASKNIKLPYKPDYINEKENIKNFLVRLLARTMFCWFVKEKGLIKNELLELTDWQQNKYKLTDDIDDKKFLKSNSYYRGILQNIFFNALNQKEKKTKKDFGWTKYWNHDFKVDWLTNIPYLNGGIFDKLDEDNAKESIEDTVLKVPNFLFYGIEEEIEVTTGRGSRATTSIEKVEHKGLNGILKSYKFTLDENTPFEEDIALDPEMLGLVFENLLAELDPNLEESTIKSIRKQTGSYYTPRKVIFEMVNDSLNLYLSKYINSNYPSIKDLKAKVNDLIYYNILKECDTVFEQAVVDALDQYKILDPACGSGAFPMGMLHRIVDLLKLVDENNEKWVELKLKNVDKAQRTVFKKVLTSHLDDYGRKLGIIRDSIYGIDIQPLAVQITKLRFFISLLIDQKTAKGITPMPNIETKIICADSLKNIQADLFSKDAISKLIDARARYYQPDISQKERQSIGDEIIDVLDVAFPSFSLEVTGKRIAGQNKEMLRHWFTHGTLAAPFFNMDFFYPELSETGGFDCIIGNPPYGGTKISDDVRSALDIESKDPYGAFIARFLNSYNQPTPLKHGGVLAYIVSDTFMTIKSHLKLRKHLMQNYVHKMLRVHPDTFNATVNTVVMVAERNTQKEIGDKHICLMADLTNISIHDNYEHFVEVLNLTKGVDFESVKANIANEEYAIYYYPQALIKTNSNLPFFVASPTLFNIINDSCPIITNGRINKCYKNGNLILFQLGDDYDGNGNNKRWKKSGLFRIASGIKTGNNSKYLATIDKDAQKNFERVDTSKLLTEAQVKLLPETQKKAGITGKKAYVRFEMGMPSDTDNGVLPCYFQPDSSIAINWSKDSYVDMKNESHSDLANSEFRFLPLNEQISFSFAGQYAPTFRIASAPIFLNAASRIHIPNVNDVFGWLGFLNSKLFRFKSKSFINHTVNFGIDDLKRILTLEKHNFLKNIVSAILDKQFQNENYDYASHEQIEIDKLVYEAYGLNAEDVNEVENWYARRYAKLSAAQKANLRALGKSDDYLELYGLK